MKNLKKWIEEKVVEYKESTVKEARRQIFSNQAFKELLDQVIPDIPIDDTDWVYYYGTSMSIWFNWWSWPKLAEIIKRFQEVGWEITSEPKREPEELSVSVNLTHPLVSERLRKVYKYTNCAIKLSMSAPIPSEGNFVTIGDECVVVKIGSRTETNEVPIYDIVCKDSAREMRLIQEE